MSAADMRKRWLGAALAAAWICAAGCTDPNAGSLARTLPEGSALSGDSVEVVFEEPMSSEEAAAFAEIEIPEFATPAIEVAAVETPVPVFTATPGPAESFVYAAGDTIRVRYYDMETMEPHVAEYPVQDASDPQAVLDGVRAAYEDILGTTAVKISGATYSDGNLFVDFDPSIYSLGIGSAGEMQILDSIADTYLTNIAGIRAVFYTVDGEPYNSENISTNANEAFKTVAEAEVLPS